ncbi:hypothetical protein H310_12405 [Aphanomyces invadans]|uniref:Amino acid transporter transmembrane domain-containing protein n=1 Tax=Aphanomyces invadans TaxID=157072 RepID=A0A024TJT6_9STRA|nr:hypothetical protein H310_12405 [Aphanomyces invadans]ETV93622.1 hypothetical protein H310_12405 [Aphanomyces invadans]|eukprot:XP_008877663.1 hypothetical protein H310_12405 [Aphanomyces invadans]
MPSKNGVEGLPLLAPASSSVAQTHQGSIFSSYVGILCAMLGAGIMTLPSTVAATTPLCGVWLLVVTGLLAFASLRCLCIVADVTGEYSYEHFGKRFFHPVLQWILRLLTLVPCFGACVIYMIVAMDMVLSFVPWISRPVLSALFAVLTFPLCLLDTFHALQYSNTIVIACIFYITGVLVHHAWGLAWPDLSTLPGAVTWGALAYAIPIQTFSFCCHFNYMRVYGELEHKPSMTIVTWLVMGSAACIYATYSLAGYLVFAGLPPHDILTGFAISDASISGVRLALAVCMLCKTPLAYQPVRDLAEVVCLPKLAPLSKWGFRLPFTLVFFLAVYGVAITVNDLSVVMDWIGATDGILVSFVVPGMFLYAATTTKGCQERLPLYAAPLALSMTTVGVVLTVFSIYRLVIV